MANDTTKNPWIIDTAAAGAITTDRMRIKTMRWIGATTAGHQLAVKDSPGGRVVWESFANGANFQDEMHVGGVREGDGQDVDGIAVTTLSSGKLYIYFL